MTATETGRLVLLRHGETEWSRSGKHTGATDVPLTDEGERRARAVAPLLEPFDFGLVLTSPRRRARRTADLSGHPDPEVLEDLAEFDYGDYEGVTSDEIHDARPGWDLWRDGAPEGESAADVRARVERVIDVARPVLEGGRDVLAVAHGHVLRALGAAWIDLPPDGGALLVLDTAGIAVLGHEHGNRVLERWNVQA